MWWCQLREELSCLVLFSQANNQDHQPRGRLRESCWKFEKREDNITSHLGAQKLFFFFFNLRGFGLFLLAN